MASRGFWAGWVGFAGVLMVVIGILNFFQGLIAIIRDNYYVLTPEQIIVFDLTAWGWIMLIWGIVIALAGAALVSGRSWARWFTISSQVSTSLSSSPSSAAANTRSGRSPSWLWTCSSSTR
jgi:hypothetical protein